jgi:hypothetical protein
VEINSRGSLSFSYSLLSYPHVLPQGRVYKAYGAPLQNDRPYDLAIHVNSMYSQSRELSCNHIHQAYSPGRRVLHISKRPKPVNLVHCSSCNRHEPFCYNRRRRPTPKNTLRGNPGCADVTVLKVKALEGGRFQAEYATGAPTFDTLPLRIISSRLTKSAEGILLLVTRVESASPRYR